MSEYNNPRPLPTASASDPCTIVDNAVSLDKVINGNGTVTTYTGKQILSLSQAIDKFGFGVSPFTFAQGGILQSKNLLVSNSPVDNFLYKYVGSGSMPLTVSAGTNPTVGGYWQQFTATDHNFLSNRNAAGSHDDIYPRLVTVEYIATGECIIGTTVMVSNRDNFLFKISAGSIFDNSVTLYAGDGKVATIIPQNGVVTMKSIGCVGDVDPADNTSGSTGNAAKIQSALDEVGIIQVNGSNGLFLLDGDITIPAGKSLVGLFCGLDSSYKTNNTPSLMQGSWIVSRGAQILMSDNTKLKGFGQWYDQQNYNITYDALKPDGCSDWVVYEPSIEFVGSYSSCCIEDMIPLGMTHWFAAKTNAHNLEKPRIQRIVGMPLLVGIEIDLSSDMVRFENIHFNPNSLFRLPNYTPTEEKSAKYVRNFTMFSIGRVDGGWITNCFGFAGRDFVHFKYSPNHLDAVGGSLRLTNCAADVYHNFLRIEQTARGFGIDAANCWGALTVWDIVDENIGELVNRRPCIVRFGDDAAGVLVGSQPALENAHVTIHGFKRFGQQSIGIPGTARPAAPFAFDSPDGKRLTIIGSDIQIDEHSTYVGDTLDGDALYGAVLAPNLQRSITLSNSVIRNTQTDTWDIIQSCAYKSAGTSYGKIFNNGVTDVLGSDTQPFFDFVGREFGDPNYFGLRGIFKDASNLVKMLQVYRGTQTVLDVDRATGNVALPVGLWNEGHLVIGNIHLWNDGANLRIKNGAPNSSSDGSIV